MIICTRCGTPNQDEARFCAKCRHKLQSSRKAVQLEESSWRRLEKMTNRFSEKDRAELLRMAEACAYSLAVVTAVVFSILYGDWRPLYAVVAVVALVAWVRKI